MDIKISGPHHSDGSAFAVITFKCSALNTPLVIRILQRLRLETGVTVFSYARRYQTKRTSLGFHVEQGAVAVLVSYQHRESLGSCTKEAVDNDVKAIADAFKEALLVFDR